MNKNSKKAQQEIVGLMIIIVILTFAILFFVILSFNNPPLPRIKDVTEATSILNIISQVNVCDQVNLEEAVKSCALSTNICNKNACELVKEETQKMLRLILKPKEGYNITIKEANRDILDFGDCKGDRIASSRKIPTYTSVIDLNLVICKE